MYIGIETNDEGIAFALQQLLAHYSSDLAQTEVFKTRPIGMWVLEDFEYDFDDGGFNGNMKKAIEKAGGKDKLLMEAYDRCDAQFDGDIGMSWSTVHNCIQEVIDELKEEAD